MEQKDPLEAMVESVEQEAGKFATFDEYLASQKGEPCQSANVEVSSSKIENGSEVQGPDASSPSSDVAAVSAEEAPKPPETPDSRKLAMEKPDYISNGLKTEPVEPPTPDVSQLEPTDITGTIAPQTETIVEVHDHPTLGVYFTEFQQIRKDEPDWWKTTYFNGRQFVADAATVEEIIDMLHDIEDRMAQLRLLSSTIRGGFTERLSKENAPRRAALLERDKNYRSAKNAESGDRMKKERAPKTSAKKTKGMHAVDSFMTMYTLEETLEKLKEFNLLDELTEMYAAKQYGGTK